MRHDRQAQDHRTAQQRAFEWACKAEDGIPPSPGAMRELAIMWAAVAGALDPEPVDLEPQTSEPAPDTLDAEDETADTWAVPHEVHLVHLVHQVESRPGPPDADGARWMEHRKTGLALAACQCGWTTGWIPLGQLPGDALLHAGHPDQLHHTTPHASDLR